MLRSFLVIATLALPWSVMAQTYPQSQYPQSQYPPPQYPQPGYPPQNAPAQYSPEQLDQIVARIALYPDPLLAQVMAASTFWDEIPDAAAWARAHSYLDPETKARAINDDQLPWDPSILGLLQFPSVLDQMASDMSWTQALGNAVLGDRASVMDAVQHQRQLALNYGYLASNAYYRVVPAPGDIQILPVDPTWIYVPYYDPRVVYYRPRSGFFVGGAITFGPRVFIGGAFAPFGWGGIGLNWRSHFLVLNGRSWDRRFDNRDRYVHRYDYARPRYEGPRVEHHEMHEYREPEHRAPERRAPEHREHEREHDRH